jgi:hypothetical protein
MACSCSRRRDNCSSCSFGRGPAHVDIPTTDATGRLCGGVRGRSARADPSCPAVTHWRIRVRITSAAAVALQPRIDRAGRIARNPPVWVAFADLGRSLVGCRPVHLPSDNPRQLDVEACGREGPTSPLRSWSGRDTQAGARRVVWEGTAAFVDFEPGTSTTTRDDEQGRPAPCRCHHPQRRSLAILLEAASCSEGNY